MNNTDEMEEIEEINQQFYNLQRQMPSDSNNERAVIDLRVRVVDLLEEKATALEKQREEMLIRGELSTIEWVIAVINNGRNVLKHTDGNTMDILKIKLEMLQKKDKEFLANLTPQKDE